MTMRAIMWIDRAVMAIGGIAAGWLLVAAAQRFVGVVSAGAAGFVQ
jgi:hypothetical protein